MLHALRAPDGSLLSLHREPVAGSEPVAADAPELASFLGTEAQLRFASMDANLVRVLEDLVDVLITRNVICITDLPPEAQQKLFERKHFRDKLGRKALQLFDVSEAPGQAESAGDAGLPPMSPQQGFLG